MNSLNTIIANAMEKSKLGEAGFDEYDIFSPPSTEEKIYFDDTIPLIYDDYNDKYDILSPPTIEEKINYDYNMPPIFDDYGDENNNDSYFIEFAPTTIDKNDYDYVESINSLMHVAHDKNVLCDSYIDNFIHIVLCFHDLFLYKILFHRKWVRLKSASYLLFYALFASSSSLTLI
jgi:hypothetical protein